MLGVTIMTQRFSSETCTCILPEYEKMRNTMRLNPVVLPQSWCISTRRLCVELRMHPFPPSFLSFRPVAHPRRHLSGIFKCILQRGSPRHHRDFPSRTRRGRKGFSASFCATGRKICERGCLQDAFDSGTNVFRHCEISRENLILWILSYFMILCSESDAHSYCECSKINKDHS